ncbi:MAG TPA: hypothetical protein VFV50_15250, partial [Bdellovibrionales bacterium]|nr:hypothetical protein [Bdellovibrionales bacterium]
NLNGLGFTLPGQSVPVWEPSLCQPDPRALARLRAAPMRHTLAKGRLHTRVTGCEGSRCVSHKDSENFRRAFSGELTLVAVTPGWLRVETTAEGPRFDCSYHEASGRVKECRRIERDQDGHVAFMLDLLPIIGADCVTLRGLNYGYGLASTEEYVLYFPGVRFSSD